MLLKLLFYGLVFIFTRVTLLGFPNIAMRLRREAEGGVASQGDQDLCVVAAAEYLIFKTSTEERTVDLTNKDTTKDSQRFSR